MKPNERFSVGRPSAKFLILAAFLVAWLDIALLFNADWKTTALASAFMVGGIAAVFTAIEFMACIAAAIRRRTAGHEGTIETISSFLLLIAITSGSMAWGAFLWPTNFISRHESAVTSTLLAILALSVLGLSVLWPDHRD